MRGEGLVDRWFCFDGMDFHRFASARGAQRAAEEAIEAFRIDAWSQGTWDDAVRRVCWGHILEGVYEETVPLVSGDVSKFCLDSDEPKRGSE
jgi:hypothetical protein